MMSSYFLAVALQMTGVLNRGAQYMALSVGQAPCLALNRHLPFAPSHQACR